MRRELGIRAGEIWAFRESTTLPLMRARIVDPGTHYDAYISSVLIDYPDTPRRSARRVKYPCKWDRLEEYLERERTRAREWAAENRVLDTTNEPNEPHDLNVSVPELLALAVGRVATPPIAYDIATAATTVGYSEATIRRAMALGDLAPRYANSKAIILHEDLLNWVHSLPTEPPFPKSPGTY